MYIKPKTYAVLGIVGIREKVITLLKLFLLLTCYQEK